MLYVAIPDGLIPFLKVGSWDKHIIVHQILNHGMCLHNAPKNANHVHVERQNTQDHA